MVFESSDSNLVYDRAHPEVPDAPTKTRGVRGGYVHSMGYVKDGLLHLLGYPHKTFGNSENVDTYLL